MPADIPESPPELQRFAKRSPKATCLLLGLQTHPEMVGLLLESRE